MIERTVKATEVKMSSSVHMNDEQRLAVFQNGSVVLSAGAGSGKTFVLIEHVVFKLASLLEKVRYQGEQVVRLYVRENLSHINVMTFTNKAANEIRQRLKKRIEEIDGSDWGIVCEELDFLFVGTIHGFCNRLIRQGYITNAPSEISLCNEYVIKNKIEILFDNFCSDFAVNIDLGRYVDIDKKKLMTVFEILEINKNPAIDAVFKIFNDASFRAIWSENLAVFTRSVNLFSEAGEDFFKAAALDDLTDEKQNVVLSSYIKDADKAWYQLIHGWPTRFQKKNIFCNLESFVEVFDFLTSFKRLVAPKNVDEDILHYFEQLKKLRDLLKKYYNDIYAYISDENSTATLWNFLFSELVSYVEKNYDHIPKYNYADLEYYVYSALKNNAIKKNISNKISYLIVDEFQDTSFIQYEIIKGVVGGDFQKLYLLGDIKQAIYGFRGGEIAVFKDCMERVQHNNTLAFNYRSKQKIIEFNNAFFETLFAFGKGHKGIDKNFIPVIKQKSPEDVLSKNLSDERICNGLINRYLVNLASDKDLFATTEHHHSETVNGKECAKISQYEVDTIEAEHIVKFLLEMQKKNSNCSLGHETTCLLYKKLTPLKLLLPLLLENNIPFVAQVKINISDDPVFTLFVWCLEYVKKALALQLDENDYFKFTFQVNGLIRYIALGQAKNLKSECCDLSFGFAESVLPLKDFVSFFKNVLRIGVWEWFKQFLKKFKIANSNFTANISLIKTLVNLYGGDVDKIFLAFKNLGDENYSIDFSSGDILKAVSIMTTHASKGLEFDNVVLCGIHSNGRTKVDTSLYGKTPASFQWYTGKDSRKKHKSLSFIIEKLVNDQKEFSESKRLFYVACTRAKKTLTWFEVHQNGEPISTHADSWINGISAFFERHENDVKKLVTTIVCQSTRPVLNNSANDMVFHKNNLGLHCDSRNNLDQFYTLNIAGIISDLSVTRLASIVDCPTKFYLQNICKFSSEDIGMVDSLNMHKTKNSKSIYDEGASSSVNRGTLIHGLISDVLTKKGKNCFATPEDISLANRVVSKYQKYFPDQAFVMYSEFQIKFNFFIQQISGVIDLLVLPLSQLVNSDEENLPTIVDFKTGSPLSSTRDEAYWFQLYSYAFSLYQNEIVDKGARIKILLDYVDHDVEKLKILDFKAVLEYLEKYFYQLNNLSITNLNHCPFCKFGNICHVEADATRN